MTMSLVWSAFGLPIYSPVNDDGAFAHTNDLPVEQQMPAEWLGKSILEKHGKSDANEVVLHELRLRHALLNQENYHHSYPHCWRSKTPVIFRAMDQWFIKIDHAVRGRRDVPAGSYRGDRPRELDSGLGCESYQGCGGIAARIGVSRGNVRGAC